MTILCAFILAAFAVSPVFAQRTTSQQVVQTYQAAQKLLEEGKTREALELVREQLRSDDLTADERTVLLRFEKQLEVELTGEVPNPETEAILENGPQIEQTEREREENYFFLGRLHLATEPPDYGKAIENFRKYIAAADNPDPDVFFYLGQALAMTGRCKECVPQAEKAIALSETPKENHYRLLLFCYSELEDYEKLVQLAERMLTRFSVKDEYLSQLAWGYQELGRDEEAFQVQAFRYELGFLDSEAELVGMADLYLVYDNPHRAARILEKEMKAGRVRRTERNLEKLGNMWFLAREHDKALVYLKQAARKSKDGKLDFRIGQVYFEREEWPRAERHFRRALKKGGVKEPCQVHVLLAHALYSQDKVEEAREEFRHAAKSEACAEEAGKWADYLGMRWVFPRKSKNFDFMTKVINELQNSSVAISDDENTRAIAAEALKAAGAALAADSEEVRRAKLSEYRRARDAAMRRLNAGALEDARKDRAEVEKLLARASRMDLSTDETGMLKRLDDTSKRRIQALEEAQADLEKAAKIMAKAGGKDNGQANSRSSR